MTDKELVDTWIEHDFNYPGYQKAVDAFARIHAERDKYRDAIESAANQIHLRASGTALAILNTALLGE